MAMFKHISISCLPDEVLELIASQLTLSFRDVVSFSTTSRRIHEATRFLVSQPLCIEDPDGTDVLEKELSNTQLGLVRSAVINIKFTLAKSQTQSEQLRQLLLRAPRLRYLSIRRPAPDPLEAAPRFEPSRSKTSSHPFPLRSSHFQSAGPYLKCLTHLELVGLSIHPLTFSYLPCLTHLKLSLSEQHDAFLAAEALGIIASARTCRLVGLEMSMHAGLVFRERVNVLKACVTAWPDIEVLNLFSTHNGRIPSLFHRWQNPEDVALLATELAKTIEAAQRLKDFALGIIPVDAKEILPPTLTPPTPKPQDSPVPGSLASLGTIFRTACPSLQSFRCLVPVANRTGKRPFAEFHEVARATWCTNGWECTRESLANADPEIFGML